jgi:hypothetical protein
MAEPRGVVNLAYTPAKDVQKQARAEGIAEVTLRRTREALNIVPAKIKGDFAGPWMWELPHHVGIANEMLTDIKPF